MEEKLPEESENPQVKNSKKIIFFVFAIISLLIITLSTFVYRAIKNNENNNLMSNAKNKISNITPTPFPFEEITIPYLRTRKYESSLGEMTQIGNNTNYTSFLTSYDSDGNKINGLLTVPLEDKPVEGFPAIVFIHGYIPPANYKTLENYSAYVDYLARNGFVVFKIDLRGHGQSEGEPGGGYYSSDYVIDTLNARAALLNTDFVNKEKVGLWGHSMAGNVVSRALAAAPEIPAVVIWAGAGYTYSDLREYMIQDSSYQPPSEDSPGRRKRTELFNKYGQFSADSSFWKMVPFTNYLEDIKGAISLNHAVDDSVVSIKYSRNLNEILNKTSIKHELNEYSSGGHNISGESFNDAMQNTVSFFKENL